MGSRRTIHEALSQAKLVNRRLAEVVRLPAEAIENLRRSMDQVNQALRLACRPQLDTVALLRRQMEMLNQQMRQAAMKPLADAAATLSRQMTELLERVTVPRLEPALPGLRLDHLLSLPPPPRLLTSPLEVVVVERVVDAPPLPEPPEPKRRRIGFIRYGD